MKFASITFVALLVIVGAIVALDTTKSDKCLDKGRFINPRFACGESFVIDKGEYREFRHLLEKYIEEEKKANRIIDISIFFRDLESGPTMGINERKDYIPASLLKLPLVMAYYSMAEGGTEDISHTIVYDGDAQIPDQTFLPGNPIEKGKSYSTSVLIEHAIVNSDNVAAQSLYTHLLDVHGKENLTDTYRNLGVLDPSSSFDSEAVNTKGYASLFRQLYNVSFLNPEYSEKLLSLLAGSYFREGLVAGVPEGVAVAHKFGERSLGDGVKQLHDCGIIYYPGNPYTLCVMTKGTGFSDLVKVISDVSSKVYQEVDSRRVR